MADSKDIRHFLAVARSSTLSGATRGLKVDHATVSRRLAERPFAVDVLARFDRRLHDLEVRGHLHRDSDDVDLWCGKATMISPESRRTFPPVARDIWLVVHRDLRKTSAVRALMDFIVTVVSEHQELTNR